MKEINAGVIAEFRENGGDLSGPMAGAPILLLTTLGRTTGDPHTTPLGFVDVDGRIVVAAANGGADTNPDWFQNIELNSSVIIEVPGASIPAIAAIADTSVRSDLLAKLESSLPGMSDHVAATSRDIPVIVFSEAKT